MRGQRERLDPSGRRRLPVSPACRPFHGSERALHTPKLICCSNTVLSPSNVCNRWAGGGELEGRRACYGTTGHAAHSARQSTAKRTAERRRAGP